MISLYFIGRDTPISIALSYEDEERMRSFAECDKEWDHYIEMETFYGQSVWINTQKLQFVRFLEEVFTPKGSRKDIPESPYRLIEAENNEELADNIWSISIWFCGRSSPIFISDVSGFGWVDIITAFQGVSPTFSLSDEEEGLDIAARVDQIDLVIGTEPFRYSPEQKELLKDEIKDA